MEKLKMHSPNLTQENIARIRDLFPGCITEAKGEDGSVKLAVDFDQLRQELAESIVEGPQERYHLNWPGKREALLTANAPIAKTLRPCREESVDFDTTKNLFIEGDNLDALKLLQETYLGKVKLIYIDPPYNTGNDFIYEDDFAEDTDEYLRRSNQVDEDGNRLVANTVSNGRFHSDWLSMIYSRLRLARGLLKEDGAIFISINDAEFENLKSIASEVFGAENFVGTMVWAAGRKNDSRFISASHEYIICFARSMNALKERGASWQILKKGLTEIEKTYSELRRKFGGDDAAVEVGLRKWYSSLSDSDPSKRHKHYQYVDKRGIYFASDLRKPQPTSRSRYEILHPITGKPVNMHPNGWSFAPERMKELLADERIRFGADEKTRPTLKVYLHEANKEAAYSVFYQDGRGASIRLDALMEAHVFDFPKDETIIQALVEMTTAGDDIVMDFFAGSATTAHATFAANSVDGSSRRFVMIQLPEEINDKSDAYKAGYTTIADVSRERIRRAGRKIVSEFANGNIDTGFRVLKIDTSNMAEVFYTPDAVTQANLLDALDNIKPDRTPEDLLFQVMLDWGVDLALPIEKKVIQGKEVFFVDSNALVACFDASGSIDEDFVKELVKYQSLRVVFRDAGYKNSAVKINVEQLFKLASPVTEVKCI
ncbi:site-specific DNA-methyltransferase [Enterobacter ludwigii]|uniref:site-specific DNA-methyltransferase n=1 Tax=Enterobacter ludwigii TaxID=299767 RepID=UPI001B39BF4B|nr:site-specific DNA-methyltransferase [Enterobacter ludwigii]MBQ0310643.1 site-specific DNA-methyltransferase [Enterobacter ludwigii]MDP5161496.1 site-specific DNA-methyltransferase [Enterobacter ludwigii]MDV8144597.1 site-specific DNA-methyltransferase [Enterobacter ludwigii]WNJ00848.1 site-specific DNA-methyltransferase [Enterobacter ludwigii]WNJ06581.1 site-specific DNA-methyltransferase [Enterobacter ludwigii]